jgi:hypothetical protein
MVDRRDELREPSLLRRRHRRGAHRDVGNTDPVVAPTSANATSSSSMLHQQMKELETAAPPPQAVLAETYAVMTNAPACNPAAVAITDEYGFKYNCLGYRIR